jgi:hypothetical protein
MATHLVLVFRRPKVLREAVVVVVDWPGCSICPHRPFPRHWTLPTFRRFLLYYANWNCLYRVFYSFLIQNLLRKWG